MLLPVTGPRIISQTAAPLQLLLCIVFHRGFLSSIFEPFTDCWLMVGLSLTAAIRAGTFPRSQSTTAVPDVGRSIIFIKGRTFLIFFFVPMFLYIIFWHLFCPTDGQAASPLIHPFMHSLHKLPPSPAVAAEKVSLEYSKAQIQWEK